MVKLLIAAATAAALVALPTAAQTDVRNGSGDANNGNVVGTGSLGDTGSLNSPGLGKTVGTMPNKAANSAQSATGAVDNSTRVDGKAAESTANGSLATTDDLNDKNHHRAASAATSGSAEVGTSRNGRRPDTKASGTDAR